MSSAIDLLSQVLAEDDYASPTSAAVGNAPTVVNAMSSVLNFLITDAFDLGEEESLWVGYQLGTVLAPLERLLPDAIMGAVQKEMETQEYSKRMVERGNRFKFGTSASTPVERDPDVKSATISQWVEALSQTILTGYPNLRPMLRASIVGSLYGLLEELGVAEDPRKSRPTRYLPTAVRYLL
jgi:hypothetical protein